MIFKKYKYPHIIVTIVLLGLFLLFAMYPVIYCYKMNNNPDLRANGYYNSVGSFEDVKNKTQKLELLYPDQDYIDRRNCRFSYVTSRFVFGKAVGYRISFVDEDVISITVKEKEYYQDDYLEQFKFKEMYNGVNIYEYSMIGYQCKFEVDGYIYIIAGEEKAVISIQRSLLDNKSVVLNVHTNTEYNRQFIVF